MFNLLKNTLVLLDFFFLHSFSLGVNASSGIFFHMHFTEKKKQIFT